MAALRPTLYTADWVLPVAAPPIRRGAVLVDGAGHIAAVGPAEAARAPEAAARIDLGAAALLPGLVDVHAHPELAAFRGLLDDLPFHLWIPTLHGSRLEAGLDAGDATTAAAWTCVEAIAAGITTLGATESSGAAVDAFTGAGVRGVVYREVFGPAPAQAADALAELGAAVAELRGRAGPLVRVGISPHAPYTVSDALFRGAADMAREQALPIAVHAAEAEAETLLVRDGAGPFAGALARRGITVEPRARSTIALLERTGVLAARPLLIHCVRVDAADIRLVADAGAAVAHCPIANARLGHGIAPVLEMLEAGITVGIGTDSVASNNRLDVLEETHIAQAVQRARRADATALPADTLLRHATLEGARALGLADRIGSLEPGKEADLCAVSLAGAHVIPVNDPAAAVLHAARGSDVVLAAVAGRVLYRDGRHTTLEPEALRPRIEEMAVRLRSARDSVLGRLAGVG